MRRFAPLLLFPALVCLPGAAAAAAAEALIHHSLAVRLDPAGQTLEARDVVVFPEEILARRGRLLEFELHDGLAPTIATPGAMLEAVSRGEGAVPTTTYRLSLPPGARTAELAFRGRIHHPLEGVGEEYARGQRESPGIIGGEGVFLSGASRWYPVFDVEFLSFDLEVRLPGPWDAVSQGTRAQHRKGEEETHVRWESREPQGEIYLVAGAWTEYAKRTGATEAMVFLREPDPALAEKFIQATFQYLRMYAELIGPYPYAKFALVENFWETGYGMPSFTLLGSRVLRFPFILTSSYPHEILHTWWGNGVAIDYERGNWGEGLTAYLSDHLLKEQQGNGTEYRLNTLQKYADYVLTGRDLPLTAFRSRHGSVSEAVGYGKSLMFFHMLRRKLGDEAFRRGLRDFYRDFRFKTAGFDDLRRRWEAAAGVPLDGDFAQWVTRTGAPQLRIAGVNLLSEPQGFLLRFEVEQVQPGEPYRLEVPVAVTLEGESGVRAETVLVEGSRTAVALRFPARPLRVDLDPAFDLFRRLDRREIPPALSQAFGAEKALIVLPAAAPAPVLRGYRELAEALRRSGPGAVEVTDDATLAELPSDRSPWILGWENRFLPAARSSLAASGAKIGAEGVGLDQTTLPRAGHAFVLSGRHPQNPDLALLWIGVDELGAVPGLGRKLPHYHKYSYLAFAGFEPENVAKGRWPVIDSPLSVQVPAPGPSGPRVEMGTLPKRAPLISPQAVFSEERLGAAVRFLAGEELQGRGFGSEGLERAAAFIAAEFAAAGLRPGGDGEGSFFQRFTARGGDPERDAVLKNVIGIIPGANPAFSGQSVVVGAHYDHLGLGWPDVRAGNGGQVHPGADDNASGVAVLLELARVLGREWRPERAVVFAAFAGEEGGRLGSRDYVRRRQALPAEQCIGMITLDGVGRPRQKRLLVLGGASAAEWVHIFRGAGYVTGIETAMVTEELDASDQVSFRECGIPAVQLTTGPHPDYHRPSDTAGKIDAFWLAGVAALAKEAVEYLAGRPEPLAATLGGAKPGATPGGARRTVSLGTVPDFTFGGPGVRLEGVVAGSPAERAGLRAGDILVAVNGTTLSDLKGLSALLKSLATGDAVDLLVLREGIERHVAATLETR